MYSTLYKTFASFPTALLTLSSLAWHFLGCLLGWWPLKYSLFHHLNQTYSLFYSQFKSYLTFESNDATHRYDTLDPNLSILEPLFALNLQDDCVCITAI